jgi:hypothetical protein
MVDYPAIHLAVRRQNREATKQERVKQGSDPGLS